MSMNISNAAPSEIMTPFDHIRMAESTVSAASIRVSQAIERLLGTAPCGEPESQGLALPCSGCLGDMSASAIHIRERAEWIMTCVALLERHLPAPSGETLAKSSALQDLRGGYVGASQRNQF